MTPKVCLSEICGLRPKTGGATQKKTSNRYSTYIHTLCISYLYCIPYIYIIYNTCFHVHTHTIIHNNSSYPSTYNYLFVHTTFLVWRKPPFHRRENSCLVGLVISQRRVQVARVPKGSGAWRSGDPGDPSKIQDVKNDQSIPKILQKLTVQKVGDGSELLNI